MIIPMPKKNLPDGFLFVLKAIDKKGSNDSYKYIQILNQEMRATDGKRVHIWKHNWIERLHCAPGIYNIEVLKDKIIIDKIEKVNYPDIDRVLPKYNSSDWFFKTDHGRKTSFGESRTIAKIMQLTEGNYTVNYDYIKYLDGIWELKNKTSPFMFEQDDKKALIMGLEINE